MTEPQYSHGFVIPLMAAGLAWWRRGKIPPGRAKSGSAGLGVLVLAILCHLVANDLYLEALDAFAFVLAFAGIVLLVWGSDCFEACGRRLGFWPS